MVVEPNTWSPTENSCTFLPVASISPENTPPRMVFLGLNRPKIKRTANGTAFRIRQSPEVTAVAWVFAQTSLSFGTGFGHFFIWSNSGQPYWSYTAGFIVNGNFCGF